MLAAAPGSSRCSGSGSFLASARGCRPPALVDRVSVLCGFSRSLRRVAPPATPSTRGSPRNNQQTCLRTPAARRAHVHLRAERRRELVRRRREVEPLGARDERLARARAGPQEVEVRGDAPPRRRVHDLDGDAVAPAAAVCYVFLEDLRRCCCRLSVACVVVSTARAPTPRPQKTRRRLGPPSAPGRRSPCRRAPRRRRARRASRARATPRGRAPCRATRAPAPGLANGRSGRRTRAGSGPRATRPTARA